MEIAKKAAKETNQTTRELYADAVAGASEDVIAQMPKAQSFGKSMRDQRKGSYPKAPKSIIELEMPHIKTLDGADFLMFDSGPNTNRIIIFATQESMDFMSTCETLYMDGTVSSGPTLFDQIYVVHGENLNIFGKKYVSCRLLSVFNANDVFVMELFWNKGSRNGWRMPLLFALSTNKDKATYNTIFNRIKYDQAN